MNARENYLIAARGGKPQWVPVFFNDSNTFVAPHIFADPETGKDIYGVSWSFADVVGAMPDLLNPIMSDISQWRTLVSFPDLDAEDWKGMAEAFFATADPDKVNVAMVNTYGPFLVPIHMLGWEEGMLAIYDNPTELFAFMSAITDFICANTDHVAEYIKPEIYSLGDDIAGSNGPFISFEVWRELYRPLYQRIIDKIHGYGALAEFHCCGNNMWLIDELIDMGIDIWQLPMPNADLLERKQRFGSRLVITGGWDRFSPAGRIGASEQEVRASARLAVDNYGSEGGLIFWDGSIFNAPNDPNAQERMGWLYDEIDRYSRELYAKK